MIYPGSDLPGNELRDYFSCQGGKIDGGSNIAGVCSKAIDSLIETIINAQDRTSLATAGRALDRLLLWNWYMVPNWHDSVFKIAAWNRFGRPEAEDPRRVRARRLVDRPGAGRQDRRPARDGTVAFVGFEPPPGCDPGETGSRSRTTGFGTWHGRSPSAPSASVMVSKRPISAWVTQFQTRRRSASRPIPQAAQGSSPR